MKRLLIVMTMVIALTGCGPSGLENYKNAVEATASYRSGATKTRLSVDIVFNETGLSPEMQRDLSYFEGMTLVNNSLYINQGEEDKAVVESYVNFGGLGFDMFYYFDQAHMLVKLPIIDKYIAIDTLAPSLRNTAGSVAVTRALYEGWVAVLMEGNVVAGKKDYIMTNQRQIKTTTYNIKIDDSQYERLREKIIKRLEDEALLSTLVVNGKIYGQWAVDPIELTAEIKEALLAFQLESFEGKAFVDDEGRLVKQDFICILVDEATVPGEIKKMTLDYSQIFDQLGEIERVEIPMVEPSEMLEINEGDVFESYFPKGLF